MALVDLPPSPRSLVLSMRDIGYSLETAIADVIDNSISAKATCVHVRFNWNEGEPWIAIIDDGEGMSRDQLKLAMLLGSMSPSEEREPNDLGRFGLGLKTASFSQCKKLSVLSKKDGNYCAAIWDLDRLGKSGNSHWPLETLERKDIGESSILGQLSASFLNSLTTGTMVLWTNIDRIEDGSATKSKDVRFTEAMSGARDHLELVFHRFIKPDWGKQGLSIFFNDDELSPFDPFNTTKSTELMHECITYEGQDIHVHPYVLPHHSKVSKSEWDRFAGKMGYLNEQGFYVYRNRRLIIKSNWFRLMPKHESTKLLRVKIDIPNTLDHLWKIDVKKSNAFPPFGIRENLKRLLSKIEDSGKTIVQRRGNRLTSENGAPLWNRVVNNSQIYYEINRRHPLLEAFAVTLEGQQEGQFGKLLDTLERCFPRELFYEDITSSPKNISRNAFSHEQIETLVDLLLGSHDLPNKNKQASEILRMEPFVSNRDLTLTILKSKGYVVNS